MKLYGEEKELEKMMESGFTFRLLLKYGQAIQMDVWIGSHRCWEAFNNF